MATDELNLVRVISVLWLIRAENIFRIPWKNRSQMSPYLLAKVSFFFAAHYVNA